LSPILLPADSSGVAPGLVFVPVPAVPWSFNPFVMSTWTKRLAALGYAVTLTKSAA
jgi:hypothetical protein